MKILGWIIGLLGVAIFLGGSIDYTCLSWGNPDLTTRRLYLDHTTRVVIDNAAILGGMIFVYLGVWLYENN